MLLFPFLLVLLLYLDRLIGTESRNPLIQERIVNQIRRIPLDGVKPDLVPIATSGFCEGGTTFRIRTSEDLHRASEQHQIECLFWAGVKPDRVPIGTYYGNVIEVLNSNLFDPLVRALWQGKLALLTKCRSAPEFNISWNFIAKSLLVPAGLSLGIPSLNLAPGEYTDNKDSFIIDYSFNFRKFCPYDTDFLYQLDFGIVNNVYPFNQVVDVVRAVGRAADGGLIMLGKTYLQDPWRDDYHAVTVAFWYGVNYDDEVLPYFRHGDSLPPLRESFSYHYPGAVEFGIGSIVPIGPALTHPVETAQVFMDYVVRWPKGLLDETTAKRKQPERLPDDEESMMTRNNKDDDNEPNSDAIESKRIESAEARAEAIEAASQYSLIAAGATGSQLSASLFDKLAQLRERAASPDGLAHLSPSEAQLVAAAMAIHTLNNDPRFSSSTKESHRTEEDSSDNYNEEDEAAGAGWGRSSGGLAKPPALGSGALSALLEEMGQKAKELTSSLNSRETVVEAVRGGIGIAGGIAGGWRRR